MRAAAGQIVTWGHRPRERYLLPPTLVPPRDPRGLRAGRWYGVFASTRGGNVRAG